MLLHQVLCVGLTAMLVVAAKKGPISPNPTSEMSTDDKNSTNKTVEASDESGHEVETDDDVKEKKFLDDAMKKVLDPQTAIRKSEDVIQSFKSHIEDLDKNNLTLDGFMEEMDNLSLEVCKTSQTALWAYVTDIGDESKKNAMVKIAAEEDEIKKQYWNIIKKKYMKELLAINDPKLKRKIRIVKERGTNVQMPQSKQREEIDTMQKIWSRVTVCAYNSSSCNTEESTRTMSDVIKIFKTSNNTNELIHYWKAYRDATGKKIRPIFKDYVVRMNLVAESENFTDAGEMWRYAFEDDNFLTTVDSLWKDIKPLYDLLHDYVRYKLKPHYGNDIRKDDKLIPAHILGNLWAQEWQPIYSKVAPYPDHFRPKLKSEIHSKDLFDTVDDFHTSLGFESAKDAYQDIKDTMASANCLPSSHDMCDGVNYKIRWCDKKVTDIVIGLSKAARLLGHVQYFKHYKNLSPIFRDGPNPAFHDAISDIIAIQLTSPDHLATLNMATVDSGTESMINHLFWIALEKFPLMAYAYVLDKWRWNVFENTTLENWNEHWWDLRVQETGISAPIPRNESDLDPAAKYHVVSHVQYITYLISHVLEFQILESLCKKANHTGPLHKCSLYGVKEVGKLLSEGMSFGASEDWRTVLKTITGETNLSTEGILNYFSPLILFLKLENSKFESLEADMDKSAPIIVGAIVVFLTVLIIALYCAKKKDSARKMFSIFGLTKNGSLDIVTNEMPQKKNNDAEGVSEDKV